MVPLPQTGSTCGSQIFRSSSDAKRGLISWIINRAVSVKSDVVEYQHLKGHLEKYLKQLIIAQGFRLRPNWESDALQRKNLGWSSDQFWRLLVFSSSCNPYLRKNKILLRILIYLPKYGLLGSLLQVNAILARSSRECFSSTMDGSFV